MLAERDRARLRRWRRRRLHAGGGDPYRSDRRSNEGEQRDESFHGRVLPLVMKQPNASVSGCATGRPASTAVDRVERSCTVTTLTRLAKRDVFVVDPAAVLRLRHRRR